MKLYVKIFYLLTMVILLSGCPQNQPPIEQEEVTVTTPNPSVTTNLIRPKVKKNADQTPTGLYEHTDATDRRSSGRGTESKWDAKKLYELVMDDILPQEDETGIEPIEPYEPGIHRVEEVNKEYIYTGDETDIQIIAETLCRQLMDDMMIQEEGRDFYINEYIDMRVTVRDEEEVIQAFDEWERIERPKDAPAAPPDTYFHYPSLEVLDENTWFIRAWMKARFTGWYSPIGVYNGEVFYDIDTGPRLIIRDGASYRLVSYFSVVGEY